VTKNRLEAFSDGVFAYAISFLVIGVMWLNHHRMLDPVQWVDTAMALYGIVVLGAAMALYYAFDQSSVPAAA
jgi:uncharacterized membrane protein